MAESPVLLLGGAAATLLKVCIFKVIFLLHVFVFTYSFSPVSKAMLNLLIIVCCSIGSCAHSDVQKEV